MKNYFIVGIGFLILLILPIKFWPAKRIERKEHSLVQSTSVSPPSLASSSPALPQNVTPPAEAQRINQANVQAEHHYFDLLSLTPIIFYGKVIDQNGLPVSEADALISPDQNFPGAGGEAHDPEYHKSSDSNGLFSIWTHGLGIDVTVTKTGYYRTPSSDGSFTYSSAAGQVNAHSDANDPAIFVLRKMGETERLIVVQRDVKIPKDGTPTQVNLSTGHTYNETNGDIQVEAWTYNQNISPNNNVHYNWKCKLTVLNGGGLQEHKGGEFDFMAPENGYQTSDEIDMPETASHWSDGQSRQYFLKLANGTYARIDFAMAAGGDHFFAITSYLNPAPGHRNLEYDPNKRINK